MSISAGKQWEEDGDRQLRKHGFITARFGQEFVFDEPFADLLQRLTPHCMLRNLPDAVAIRGNQCIFIDFKTASAANEDSQNWSVDVDSIKTMIALGEALKIPSYFFFPGDRVKSAIDVDLYYNTQNHITNNFILIPRSHCEHISTAIPIDAQRIQNSESPIDRLIHTSPVLITRPKTKPRKDTTLFKVFLAIFAIAFLLTLIWFNDDASTSDKSIGTHKPQTVERWQKGRHSR